MNPSPRYSLWIFILILSLACKEDKDEIPPSIQISSPSAGQVVNIPTELTVSGRVEDDQNIESISISLIDEFGQRIVPSVSLSSPNNPEHFSISMDLSSVCINSGEHRLRVIARDGEGESRRTVNFMINGIERQLEGYVYLHQDGISQGVIRQSPDGVMEEIQNADDGLYYTIADKERTLQAIDQESRVMQQFDLDSQAPLWHSAELMDASEQIIQVVFDSWRRSSRILTDGHRILNIDQEGQETGSISYPSSWQAQHMLVNNQAIWLAVEENGTHRLHELFKSTGAILQTYSLSGPVVKMAQSDEGEILVVEEGGDLRWIDPNTQHNDAFPNGVDAEVKGVVVVGTTAYFVTDDALYRQQRNFSPLSILHQSSGIQDLAYNALEQQLLIAEIEP